MIFSSNNTSPTEKKTFMTEHNNSHGAQATEKKPTVFKIEDVDPPMSTDGKPIPLPDNSNTSRVIDNILVTLRSTNPKFKNSKITEEWGVHFNSAACQGILSDMFWYSVVKIDKRPNLKEYKKSLLERIAYNYIQVFVNVPYYFKEIFFENFYDCIAQGVFYSMFFSFPKSRTRLDSEEFKSKLFNIISTKLTGLDVNNQGFNNWILDLGAGNVLRSSYNKAEENDTNEQLPKVKGKRQTRRTLQQLRYSPFVARYLHSKRYEAINSVPFWSMRYTLRNIEKERDIAKKYTYYKNLAIDTERNAKERNRQINLFCAKIDEEIKELHNETEEFRNEIYNNPKRFKPERRKSEDVRRDDAEKFLKMGTMKNNRKANQTFIEGSVKDDDDGGKRGSEKGKIGSTLRSKKTNKP